VRELWIVYEVHLPTVDSVYGSILSSLPIEEVMSWLRGRLPFPEEEIMLRLMRWVEDSPLSEGTKKSWKEWLEEKLKEKLSWQNRDLEKFSKLTDEELEIELRRLTGEKSKEVEEKLIKVLDMTPSPSLEEKSRECWERIRRLVHEKIQGLNSSRLKVYVDSMCDEDYVEILKEDIRAGLRPEVYRDLLEFGAQFRPTEEEEVFNMYEEIEEGCKEKCKEPELRGKVEALCIMARNIAIAKRINEDLKEGETGILFIGVAHEGIEKLISPSIQCEVIFEAREWPGW